jgi:hypothetical protein
MRVRVDDAGRHPLAVPIDHERIGRRIHVLPDDRDFPVLQQDGAPLDCRADGGQDGGVPDHRRSRPKRFVGRGVRIGRRWRRRSLRGLRVRRLRIHCQERSARHHDGQRRSVQVSCSHVSGYLARRPPRTCGASSTDVE